ncbi:hypothetical protein MC885_004112 [Smutsia gigantea]|nr:hypothetical protein MC885_004112 [Smutsia gigantea]
MADTYAAVQKRGAPGAGADGAPLYSQVTPRARRPQAPADDARRAPPGLGEWRGTPPAVAAASTRTRKSARPRLRRRLRQSGPHLATPGRARGASWPPAHPGSRPRPFRSQPPSSVRRRCLCPGVGGGSPELGGLVNLGSGFLSAVPVDQSPTGPGAYEDVADGAQSSGLGFNLRIGRPKGPRDPPAEWTRVGSQGSRFTIYNHAPLQSWVCQPVSLWTPECSAF